MDSNAVLDIAMQALIISGKLAAPVLITSLVVGFAISLLQSITQIQEVTLSFVPKAVAVGIALIVAGHWMISEMVSFTTMVFDRIPQLLAGLGAPVVRPRLARGDPARRRAHDRVPRDRASVLVRAFPARVKAMLGVGLALAVAPRVSPRLRLARRRDRSSWRSCSRLVVGAVLGFLVFVVFAAVQAAGGLIDLFGGFPLAQAFDPQSMVNGAQFTRLFQMTALALMFATGGYQLIIGGLARTFDAVPLGLGMDLSRRSSC